MNFKHSIHIPIALWLSMLFFWASTAFAIDCKAQNPPNATIDQALYWTHTYTCENPDKQTIRIEWETGWPCEAWFVHTWHTDTPCVGNQTGLSCHICKKTPVTPPPVIPPPATTTKPIACTAPKQNINGECICVPGPWVCCGIKLNTTVPFIGNCIEMISKQDEAALKAANKRNTSTDPNTLQVTKSTAFPRLMLWLTKILVTVILLASFIAIIVAWVMMAASGTGEEWYSKWKTIIGSVIAALALLGASGVILRLINPNFFG